MGHAAGTDFEAAMAALKAEYLRTSPARLDEISWGISHLRSEPEDRAALERVMRNFHALAGSGATYGMPGVTALARKADEAARDLLEGNGTPGPEDLGAWEGTLGLLREEFRKVRPEEPRGLGRREAKGRVREGSTVLIVEDDPALRDALRECLGEEGWSVRLAGSAAEGMRLMAAGLPDALIVDPGLPDGSGLGLVEHARAWPGGERVAVLVVSVRSRFEEKVEALHAGADLFLDKPLDMEALRRRLRVLVWDAVSPETRGPAPPRVLSVEDDPAQGGFIRTVLESGGFEVEVCEDARRFEAEMVSFQPDLVLMDADLPGYSGYDLTRYLRLEERFATLPIVFLTASGDEASKSRVVTCGGDDLLVKPVSPGLLLTTVSARIERARLLKGLLYRDGLTQLFTRSAFLERARIVHALRTRRRDGRVALALVDLDRFKEVNDRYGHLAGDRVLSAFAALLRRRLRRMDTVGRLGGDEFAILIEDLGEDDALKLLNLCLGTFEKVEHLGPDGERFRVSFSAGVAMLDPDSPDLESWIHEADEALYAAKSESRGRVVPYAGRGASGGAR